MFFRQITVGPIQNFSYLVGCGETKKCIAIDCGYDAEQVYSEAAANGYKIDRILLTHVHYDHSGAVDKLAALSGATVYCHQASEQKRGIKNQSGAWIIPTVFKPLRDGDNVVVGTLHGKVIASPGHQNDHLIFRFTPYLFTGDTLFIGHIGRTDLPDSNPAEMSRTLEKIMALPDELIVCPGHDYGEVPLRTLGEEKHQNPSLMML